MHKIKLGYQYGENGSWKLKIRMLNECESIYTIYSFAFSRNLQMQHLNDSQINNAFTLISSLKIIIDLV